MRRNIGNAAFAAAWGMLGLMVLLTLLATLTGCGPQIVYVTADKPVRLAESVKALVWVKDGKGGFVRGTNRVIIPDGFYVQPPPTSQPTH